MKSRKIFFSILMASYLLFVIILFSGCSKKPKLHHPHLVTKQGLIYAYGKDTPYTGHEKDIVKGQLIEYDVKDGFKNGTFKLYHKNGKLEMLGKIVMNKNEGIWKYFNPDGSLESTGKFKNDKPDSTWVWYYNDGKLKSKGDFSDGKKIGKWRNYDDEGKIIKEEEFKDGQPVTEE